MAPKKVEDVLLLSKYIMQIFVYGDGTRVSRKLYMKSLSNKDQKDKKKLGKYRESEKESGLVFVVFVG